MSEARKPAKASDDDRYAEVIKHYDSLTDDEWAAEDEAAFNDPNNIVMVIPRELAPAVHKLLAKHSEAQAPNQKR